MPPLDLDDTEKAALIGLLCETIAADRYPLSPRIRTLKAIFAKLESQTPPAEPFRAPKPQGRPSLMLEKRRWR